MRTALHFILLSALALGGCGGGSFTSSQQTGGTGGAVGDASAGSGGTGGEAGMAGAAGSATGGSAGSATGGSAGSATGGTGGAAPCSVASDCPGENNECTIKICDNGLCQVTFVAANTATTAQAVGDCQQFVCDGNGAITQVVDNTDVPNDNNPCTSDQCNAGVPSNVQLAAGDSCGTGLTCDTSGHCVGCTAPQDCGPTDPCFDWTCNGGTCGKELKANGTKCGTCQVCKTGVCANVEAGKDPNNDCADVPQCGTDGTCDGGGACRFYANGTPCGAAPTCTEGLAVLQDRCNGTGACVDAGTMKCAPYLCAGNACATSCSSTLGCVPSYTCSNAGVCVDCVLCSEWYANPKLDPAQACPGGSLSLIESLRDCACGSAGSTTACSSDCSGNQNLCSPNPSPPSQSCITCLQTSCGSELSACLADQAN